MPAGSPGEPDTFRNSRVLLENAELTLGTTLQLPLHRHRLPNPIEQLEHGQPERIGDHLKGIDRRVGLSVLYPAQVGLIEAALLAKLDLTETHVQA